MTATEATPLLPVHSLEKNFSALSPALLRDELRQLVQLMYPVTLTFFLEYAPGITTLLLVGHYHDPMDASKDKVLLGAAAMAIMYLNLTGLTIGLGLASAMDTLCSQAFGARKLHEIGVFFQTGLLVLGAAFVPIALLNWHCEAVLVWWHQPPDMAAYAGEFSRVMLIGLPFLFLYELLKKVLQAQNVVLPMLYCAIFANLLNVGLGYVLTYHTPLGHLGAAVARTLANVALPASLLFYLLWRPEAVASCWPGWQLRRACGQVRKFVALGVSGLLMVLFEWWSFELLVLIAGLQANATVAIGANAILVNLTSCTYMLYFGVSTAANVRVGNALGGQDVRRAHVAVVCALGLAAGAAVVVALSFLVLRPHLASFFTSDPDIATLVARVAGAIAVYQVADAWNTTIQGVLRGCGLQMTGAGLNCIAYGIVGLPTGIFLDLYCGWSLVGLWVGMASGICLAGATGSFVLFRADWADLIAKAQVRVETL
ncbi:Multidrug/Oligosaccharidyl-lipid/Polysaccharide (MOP) Flippase Superfamily [Achlya hypogyna]|uniref:Multidrug/Oligosaccharidyl-lipid/Polysaccharide (MOP) Flippase Superfamily n=1 Tax=Achlya hypogyna TaxID=1202772 RepID=A0A1V9Z2R0_ACHHY|nr:Multidrug/Oligosaccharidyl-lipid/Polysaccharide (MOP) Flippase Superfamily [Achlya hypogyna]